MKPPSLREQILNRFRQHWKDSNNEWRHSQAICDWAHENAIHPKPNCKYTHDTIARRLREMASGKLSTGKTCPIVLEQLEDKQIYRYLPTEHEKLSINIQRKLYENTI